MSSGLAPGSAGVVCSLSLIGELNFKGQRDFRHGVAGGIIFFESEFLILGTGSLCSFCPVEQT